MYICHPQLLLRDGICDYKAGTNGASGSIETPQMVKRIVSLLVIVGMSKVANIGARDKIVYPD